MVDLKTLNKVHEYIEAQPPQTEIWAVDEGWNVPEVATFCAGLLMDYPSLDPLSVVVGIRYGALLRNFEDAEAESTEADPE